MKKKLLVLLSVLLALVVVCGVVFCFLPHPLSYPIGDIQPVGTSVQVLDETEDSVTIRKEAGGDFKVLLFTDMHLDGKNKTSKLTVSHLVENIRREKPDLVLLGGDNVTSGLNAARCKQLGWIFEMLDVYWAGVIGNHEGDNKYSVSREEMVDIFSSFEHCLMRKGLSDVKGNCNYTLEILNPDDSMLQTFFFLDTFDMVPDAEKPQFGYTPEDKVTDGARADQVGWYTEKAKSLKERYGDYSSVLVQHIPLPQMKQAAELKDFLYGVNLEGVCCTGFDSGLFDAVKAAGTTKLIFCGHDHMNNFGAMFDGIQLSYIEPSGYGSYNTGNKLGYEEKDWLQGYTRLTLRPDGSYTCEQVRNSAIED